MSSKPSESGEHLDYLSFLMRLWRVPGEKASHCPKEDTWRASLQSAQTGVTSSFADLEDLFAFLREQMGHEPEGKEPKDDQATTVIVVIHRPGCKEGGG